MTKVAIVYHSGYGHTKKQAEAVAQGVTEAGGDVQLIAAEEASKHWDDLAAAKAIIFGAPTYMGSASAKFKEFMDASSKVWAARGWKDKIGAGFTNSASQSGDKLNTLVQLAVFGAQHGMIWVGLDILGGNNSSKGSVTDLNRLGSYLGAMAQSNADESADVVPPKADLDTAKLLGKRVTEVAGRFAS